MQRSAPDNTRVQPQLLSLLSGPTMIHRSGNPFDMDSSRNRPGGYLFPTNQLPMMGLAGFGPMGQFPPQRVQGSLHNAISSPGIQSHLSLLSEMALMDSSKRGASGELQKIDAKRQKMASSEPSGLKDNPVLMERLSAMSGGFPMPKWAGIKKVSQGGNGADGSSHETAKKVFPKHGAFPMPALKDGRTKTMSNLSLRSFRELWKETDMDLREEVLARRLERASLKISSLKRAS